MDGGGGGVISGQSARMFFRGREAGRAFNTSRPFSRFAARGAGAGRGRLQRAAGPYRTCQLFPRADGGSREPTYASSGECGFESATGYFYFCV